MDEELAQRFSRHLAEQDRLSAGDGVVVAVSGGLDSLVLLHLLRFAPGIPSFRMMVAHFDHRMRAESGEDALWVRGLCRAWDVECSLGRASTIPRSESEARELRYDFLLEALRRHHGRWLLTAHHADDQAETVLFRVLRGTGLKGLAGIPTSRPPGIYRPLLSFGRSELRTHARHVGIRPRLDASNFDLTHPRNLLRHEILPRLEENAAPRARASLLRLARLARENEAAWRSLLPQLLDGVMEEDEGGIFIVREAFLAYHPAVRTRLLREALNRYGIGLDESGTRAVLEFTRTGASGRSLDLPGGYSLTREFHRLRLVSSAETPGDRPLLLTGATPGFGEAEVGGRKVRVCWGEKVPEDCSEVVSMALSSLDFPLQLRGWTAGDRMTLPYGSKKLKKLLAEARIPQSERVRTPVLVDSRGRVLWAAGLPTSALVQVREGESLFYFGIREIHER
jgi:tRNA(Ile)-lysidine synthase